MEALAARTEGGTYALVIERNRSGDVGRLEMHLSLNLGDLTDGIRRVLYTISERLSNEGERELQARLSELAGGLEDQDRGRLDPAEEASGSTRAELVAKPAALILQDAGNKKISIIKVVRELTGLGLKETRDMVEDAPGVVVKRFATKKEADRAAKPFTACGATVTVE